MARINSSRWRVGNDRSAHGCHVGFPTCFRDQLTVRYSQWDGAYRQHDVKALAAMLNSRFRIVTETRKVIRRADYVRSLWKAATPESYRTTLISANRLGNRATAMTRELSKQRGEPEHIHRYRDMWLLKSGHWMLLESRTLGEK
ncbi:MAG: DUF4440 domain-containing protein [Fimbriimonadales bacterium]